MLGIEREREVLTLQKVTVTSAARSVAEILREEILANVQDEPWFLGSEDAILLSLGVSRSTLRQALRVLEEEQLVIVRRGIGGGLFARRPTDEGVAHMVSIVLRAEGTTYKDLNHALSLLTTMCARLAAENPDAALRRRLVSYYDERTVDRPLTRMSGQMVVELLSGFFVEMARLASSPTLSLFVNVLSELSRLPSGETSIDADRIGQMVQGHIAIAHAIADGDANRAERLLSQHFGHLLAWAVQTPQLESLYPHDTLRRRTPYLSLQAGQ
jgi:GntR family transcriptional repressor for pyruvate dehydrogenase complex